LIANSAAAAPFIFRRMSWLPEAAPWICYCPTET
jgi:hypothetical protein